MCQNEFRSLLSIVEPIETECLCDFPCIRDDDEDREYDEANPSDHYQYCPVYFVAYIRAIAEDKPVPE